MIASLYKLETQGYDFLAAEKKAAGFDSLRNRCDIKPQLYQSLAAFSFAFPSMAARMGSRKARRFAPAVPGLSTCTRRRPYLTVSAAVHYTNRPEQLMANLTQGIEVPAVFNFQSHEVRIVVRNDEPWFVANDVCAALGYQNSRKAVADHLDDDERCNAPLQRGGEITVINESGLYSLVLRSRKPAARQFAKWVTSEVLPSIRKTGAYQAPAISNNPPYPIQNTPRDKFTAEDIDRRIQFRAFELSQRLYQKFLRDMREPDQFHYFRTGDNVVETWKPYFGSDASNKALIFIGRQAQELAKNYAERDREIDSLMAG